MVRFLISWFVLTVSVGLCAWALPGVHIESWQGLVGAGIALGLVNAILRPIFSMLTLPIRFLTLGLFTFVVNGAAFFVATWFVEGFSVTHFGWAIGGVLFVSIVSWVLGDLGYAQRRADRETSTRSRAVRD